jgi:lipopolysaccharide transport system permease protein
MAAVFAGLVDFFVAAVILLGMMLVYRVEFHWEALWLFPLLILQVILTLAVVLLGSAAMVLYRDVRFLIPLITQLWMYATPIVYPLDLVPDRFRMLYYLNPMVGIIDGYRRTVLGGQPPEYTALGISFLVCMLLIVFAYWIFKRVEPTFADLI